MELMSKDSFAQSAAYLKQAVPLMIKYQIPTTPDNYTLWYNYVAASMPELNQAIDQAIKLQEPALSPPVNASITSTSPPKMSSRWKP
jgi:hypothetical protein